VIRNCGRCLHRRATVALSFEKWLFWYSIKTIISLILQIFYLYSKLYERIDILDTLSYKGYDGTVEYCSDDENGDYLYGRVLGIDSALIYEGKTIDALKSDFQSMVDNYINDCRKMGTEPEKPYTGKLTIDIRPDVHRKLEIYANSKGRYVTDIISDILNNSSVLKEN